MSASADGGPRSQVAHALPPLDTREQKNWQIFWSIFVYFRGKKTLKIDTPCQFWNPTKTPSGRKVTTSERKKQRERKKRR
jgi:hypothetical protein